MNKGIKLVGVLSSHRSAAGLSYHYCSNALVLKCTQRITSMRTNGGTKNQVSGDGELKGATTRCLQNKKRNFWSQHKIGSYLPEL